MRNTEIKPVAHIENRFKGKFGIPRQSGLINTVSKIVFEPEYRIKEALRGLDGFSHLWLIWSFSEISGKWNPTVRPPVLGGNRRVGVFATRSPFRPNNIGLSCVKIEEIKDEGDLGTVIYVSGADLLNKTPIFDIKPYLPYADCHNEAACGFTENNTIKKLEVSFESEVVSGKTSDIIDEIKEILTQNPLPQYHNDPERIYKMSYGEYTVSFKVDGSFLTVLSIKSDV